MSLQLELKAQLRLSPQLKLHPTLSLEQHLEKYVPREFQQHINIETDEDMDLLRKSMAFLSLHEFAHPLYDRKKVHIPLPVGYDHNAVETGIDKAAMVLGQKIGISAQNMHTSHLAMMERVFRDYFTLKKYAPQITTVARFYIEIQEHQSMESNDIQRKKTSLLLAAAEQNFPAELTLFHAKVEEYRQIYQRTRLLF